MFNLLDNGGRAARTQLTSPREQKLEYPAPLSIWQHHLRKYDRGGLVEVSWRIYRDFQQLLTHIMPQPSGFRICYIRKLWMRLKLNFNRGNYAIMRTNL